MALTRDFRETVVARAQREPAFKTALLQAALQAFLAFSQGCILVAHNAPFDLGFLTTACSTAGIRWPATATIDTAVLARLLLCPEDVPDCRLATLAAYFGTRTAPCHRALADAKATVGVLAGLLELAAHGRPATARTPLGLAS